MFKVNNKTTKKRHWRRSGLFIVTLDQISLFFFFFFDVVDFKQLNTNWNVIIIQKTTYWFALLTLQTFNEL